MQKSYFSSKRITTNVLASLELMGGLGLKKLIGIKISKAFRGSVDVWTYVQ